MKKLFSILLAASLLSGTFGAFSAYLTTYAETETIGYEVATSEYYAPFTFRIENRELTITQCDANAQGIVEVPADINGYPVRRIEGAAFFGCTKITEIILPDGLETIGVGAFMMCSSLAKINLPDSISSIGKTAFYDTEIRDDGSEYWFVAYQSTTNSFTKTRVLRIDNHIIEVKGTMNSVFEIPEGIVSVADRAFTEAKGETEIVIPSTLRNFEKNTFRDSPESTTEEGRTIFPDITAFSVSEENPYFSNDEDGILYNKGKTVLYRYPSGKADTEFTVANTVTEIADNAFSESYYLEKIVMREPLIYIGEKAFYNCSSLADITLPDSVRRIKILAFHGTLLHNKYMAGNLGLGILYIGNHLVDFNGFQPDSIEIKNGTLTIADGGFGYLKSLSVDFPESLATVGDEAFSSRCTFSDPLKISKNLTYIGKKAFKEETLIFAFDVDEENPEYSSDENGVLYNKSKTKLIRYPNASTFEEFTVPASVTEIEPYAFAGSKNLKKINFENSSTLAFIDSFVFYSCPSLSEIELPESIKEIKKQAFEKSVLSEIYFSGTEKIWEGVVCADDTANNATVYCVCSESSLHTYVFNYMGTDYEKTFACGEKITLPEEVDSLAVEEWGGDKIPETMPCRNLKSMAVTKQVSQSDVYGVAAYYSDGAFECPVTLDAAEISADREPGGVYMVDGKTYKQIGVYNIKPVNGNGETVQPNEGYTVRIKMAVPDGYKDKTDMVIYHRFVDGGREKLSTADGTLVIENGYMIFEVSKFSEFTVLAETAEFELKSESDEHDVTAGCSSGCFDEEITLEVETQTGGGNGGTCVIDKKIYKQIGVYDMRTVNKNGEAVQPNEGHTVKIKMAVPENYTGRADSVILHRFDGGEEMLSTADGTLVIKDGYMNFEISRFGEFVILEGIAEYEVKSDSDEYDVAVNFSSCCFNEEVELEAEAVTGSKETDGITVNGNSYEKIGSFSLRTVNGKGENVQPNKGHTVIIRMAVPDAYTDGADMVINHLFDDGRKEKLSTADGTLVIEDGYMIFEVSRLGEFEILMRMAEMSFSKLPDKLNYNYKETLDLSGIRLAITGADGSVEFVTDTSKMTVEGFDSTKLGTQTVTVKYEDCSCTFEVTVNYSWWQWIIRILLLGFLWY